MQRLPAQLAGGRCLRPFCALMQMPHIHVLRVAGQRLGGMDDGGVFSVMEVRAFHPARQEKRACVEMMDAGVKVHGGRLVEAGRGWFNDGGDCRCNSGRRSGHRGGFGPANHR